MLNTFGGKGGDIILKKILILNGSPRGKRGNTAKLVEAFIEGYLSVNPNVSINHVELKNFNINGCIGCFNCWKKTPGKCIHQDDMEKLIEIYLESDIIIWATPLYHHGMTSILKKFIERTLPLNLPYIVKNNGIYGHPKRYGVSEKKNIVISNCGFPEYNNFDIIMQTFSKITNGGVNEKILCVMGELLSRKPLQSKIQWYYDTVNKAGIEFANNYKFSESTKTLLCKSLVPLESFIEMANLSWEAKGEIPPTLEKAMGLEKTLNLLEAKENLRGFNYLKLMKHSFNKVNSKGYNSILEIEFIDIKETHHFIIKDQICELKEGKSLSYTTKILTPYTIWVKISNGELDGSQAMVDGLYKVKGDLDFLMKMNSIFGSNKTEKCERQKLKDKKILGLNGDKWMSVQFIPWIISWLAISSNGIFGIWIPLLITVIIIGIKRKYDEITYFEKSSFLYFFIIGIAQLTEMSIIGDKGMILNYFSIAIIWGVSLLDKKPLTSDYSKYTVEGNVSQNIIFKKTNENLTLFWSIMFLIQGCIFIGLYNIEKIQYTPYIYILNILALKFTKWYSEWYPKKIMQG